MNYLKNLLAKLLLAACMLSVAGQAGAAQQYTVTIDTATLGSGPAYLGLYFLGLADAAPATATVNNLTGAFSGKPQLTGSVTGTPPGPLVFSSASGGGELVMTVSLGGLLSFDVGFTLGAGDAGTTFGWSLFNESSYLGADGDLGTVSLQPGAAPGAIFTVNNASGLSHVSAVPEPSSVLLMVAGMLCIVARARRRQPPRLTAGGGNDFTDIAFHWRALRLRCSIPAHCYVHDIFASFRHRHRRSDGLSHPARIDPRHSVAH